jgi:hypothetical protein
LSNVINLSGALGTPRIYKIYTGYFLYFSCERTVNVIIYPYINLFLCEKQKEANVFFPNSVLQPDLKPGFGKDPILNKVKSRLPVTVAVRSEPVGC